MKRKRTRERPSLIPFDDLKYELTPELVSCLTWAHRNVGAISSMRFSHYGYKRLESDAYRRRVTYSIMRAGHSGVTLDDVTQLLAGDLLPPRKRSVETMGRKVAVLTEAARELGRDNEPSTPETFATYLDFLKEGTTLWSRFVGQRKEKMLEIHRGSVKVSEPVSRLYEWLNEDELVADEPILRTATLYWGLSIIHPHPHEMPAIDAIVHHEIRAGSIDRRGLLVLLDSVAFRSVGQRRHPGVWGFRGSIPGLHLLLSTLRPHGYPCQRMTRSCCDSLRPQHMELSSTTPYRFLPAHPTSPNTLGFLRRAKYHR